MFLQTDVSCPSETAGDALDETQVEAEIVGHQERNLTLTDQSSQPSDEQIAVLKTDLKNEFEKILSLGTLSTSKAVFENTMRRLSCRLQKCQNPAQAITLLVSLSARATCLRKGARINVQPDATKRRRYDVTRGAKRIPAGRPSKENKGKGTEKKGKATRKTTNKKRKHSLAGSIRENKSNPKAHGH